MKIFSFFLFLGFLSIAAFSQDNNEKGVLPKDYQVDTRIDNMGYWRKMAALGLVPVQPMYRPEPAVFTGSRVFTNKGVLINDSPDVAVTDHVNTESENSIAGDPFDMEHVLNSNNSTPQPSTGDTYGTSWYRSADGGTTWSGSYEGTGGSNWGDPAACINLTGRYFVGHITTGGDQGVAYSDDQGATWIEKTANGEGTPYNPLDKNHLWVDNGPASPNQGNLYDAWMHTDGQIHICRSITNGTSYESDISISAGTNAGSHNQGVNIKTGPDGEVYCAWAVYDSWPSDEKAIGFSKSTDGGVTWSPASRILDNIRGIRNKNGTYWPTMRSNSFPSMACDLSNGPDRGALYIVWTNIGVPGINSGNTGDVYMIKSTDKGDTWSVPIRINQNAPDGKNHYIPWITCDQANGYLSVVFYDSRNVTIKKTETFMAYSMDGGNTWADMKVSDVSFTPAPIPNMAANYMGDYLGITAYGGKVYPTWTDNRLGYCMTYVSPITLLVPSAFVGVTVNILNDTTFGNGNGKMDFGETELLGLTMSNSGNAEADSVTVTLTSDSQYINITDSTEFYGNFPVGGSTTILDGFKFTVSDSIPHGLNVQFLVTARDKNDSTWTTSFFITSHAPAITIISATIVDPAPGGNGNGRLDPGETVTMNVLTENTGDFDAVNTISDLTWNNSYVTVANPSQNLGTLIPGQLEVVPFTVSVDSAAAIGSAVMFDNFAHATIPHDRKIWDEKIGLIVEDWETGDFTKFAWQFQDVPWAICDTVVFEKLHCAQSGLISDTGSSGLTLQYNVLFDDSISFHRRLRSELLTDNLNFYIDGALVGQWSGSLPEWDYSAFPVLAGPHTFKWEFLKHDTVASNNYSAWLDFIVFPPEYKTTVTTGGNASICAGLTYQLNGKAFLYDSLLWTTSGSGIFSDPKILAPVYTPSGNDINTGSVNLTLKAFSTLGRDTTSVMTLTIHPLPAVHLGNDTSICAGHHIILDPRVADASIYLWHPSGANSPTLTVDSTGTGIGVKTISVDVTNVNNCTDSGTIHVTFKDCAGIGELKEVSIRLFPNPNNGIFTLELNASRKETLDINVMNSSGVTVYSLNDLEISGFVSRKMDLGTLPEGAYLVRISNGKESALRKLVIRR